MSEHKLGTAGRRAEERSEEHDRIRASMNADGLATDRAVDWWIETTVAITDVDGRPLGVEVLQAPFVSVVWEPSEAGHDGIEGGTDDGT